MMYIPKHFSQTETARVHELIAKAPFATLISAQGDAIQITHLPLLLNPDRGPHGVLSGHMARANPHWHALSSGQHVAIFHGPHRYISPAWYQVHPSVPTWNYAVVHAQGSCTLFEDQAWLLRLVSAMTERFEADNGTQWRLPDDPEYLRTMCAHIVGFELQIDSVAGKFKLSQNRGRADRAGILTALQASADPMDRDLLNMMRE